MKKCILISFCTCITFIIPSRLLLCHIVLDFFNTIRASNSLNPDQAGHFVGPDLGPNELFVKVISADNKSRS